MYIEPCQFSFVFILIYRLDLILCECLPHAHDLNMKWLFWKHKRLPQDNRIQKYEMINHKMNNNFLLVILPQKSLQRKNKHYLGNVAIKQIVNYVKKYLSKC
jgi:hypothetical protein